MKNDDKLKKYSLKEFFKYLKFTYKFSGDRKKNVIGLIVFNILLTVIWIILPVLYARRIVLITDSLWVQAYITVAVIFVFDIFADIVSYLVRINYIKYTTGIKKNMQLELITETLKVSNEDINVTGSGAFIERINSDTEKVVNIFDELSYMVTETIGNVGIFLSVFFISKLMFLIYLVLIIIIYIMKKKTRDIMQPLRKNERKKADKVMGFSSEIVRGSRDIKILNAEKSFIKKVRHIINDVNDYSLKINYTENGRRIKTNTVWDFMLFLVALTGIYLCSKDMLSLSSLLIIANLSWRIESIGRNISDLLDKIQKFSISAERVYDLYNGDEFKKESFGDKKISKCNGNIKFENVSFAYEDGKKILNNMSFDVLENSTVAFVGKSGSGKSTIFKLISALYKTDIGTVYMDGIPVNELDKNSIRGNLSVISQDPYIFNMSIRENLQVIKSDATEDEIISACKMACLHEFIISLENGYDTIVGEGGVNLSGGQKQRLAIARALLLNTKIILFDEATSALDNETQANIHKAISNMKGDYTILIIAHRLSTVKSADTIYVVDNGRIIDSGNQNDLLKTSRTFKKLYETELEGD